jgi:predicted P-loop ATPase
MTAESAIAEISTQEIATVDLPAKTTSNVTSITLPALIALALEDWSDLLEPTNIEAAAWLSDKDLEKLLAAVKMAKGQVTKLRSRIDAKSREIAKSLEAPTPEKTQDPENDRPEFTGELSWKNGLILNDDGRAYCNSANAVKVLLNHHQISGRIIYNISRSVIEVTSDLPWGTKKGDEWSDVDTARCTGWLQELALPAISSNVVAEAVAVAAHEGSYHPIQSYLKRLKWDGTPRINTWLTTYFGAEDNAYIQAVGSKWLIGAALRALRPGTKFDVMLMAEGNQGLGKSKAIRSLCADGAWFKDGLSSSDLTSKDAKAGLRGNWIIEIAELAAMRKAEVNAVKAFMSAIDDRYRPAYGRYEMTFKRETSFFGTLNDVLTQYLMDHTGGRRFWPFVAVMADSEGITRDRDQLWAEAVHRARAGEQHWLNDEEEKLAKIQQEMRFVTDLWEPKVTRFLDGLVFKRTTYDALIEELGLKISESGVTEKLRLSKILSRAGWYNKNISNKVGRELVPTDERMAQYEAARIRLQTSVEAVSETVQEAPIQEEEEAPSQELMEFADLPF